MTPLYNECRSALVAMVLLCLAALAAPAAAQTVVDGSDRNVPPENLRAMREELRKTLPEFLTAIPNFNASKPDIPLEISRMKIVGGAVALMIVGPGEKAPPEWRVAGLAMLDALTSKRAAAPRISNETEISPRAVVDGSNRNVPPGALGGAVETMVERGFFDPYGAQFRRLQIAENRPDYLCGWINPKNRLGAFTGFRPFNSGGGFFNLLPPEDDIYYEMVALTFSYAGCPIDRR